MRKIRFRQPLQCNICKTKGFQYWEFNGQEFVPDGFDQCPCGENPAFEIVGGTQQYTGLEDKNGKPIYDGDMVRYWSSDSKTSAIHKVMWDNYKMGYILSQDGLAKIDEGLWMREWYKQRAEVIGNTHQNPELLKI